MTPLEREIEALKERVKQLEVRIFQQEPHGSPTTASPPGKDANRDQWRAWLETKSVVADLPPEAQAEAENWRKMLDTEKQEHIQSMRDLELDPPLSQIIVENRR
jgi:hypothetical protein